MKYLVLDSNIVLLDANNILTLGDSDTVIVIPSVVCDEVDSKKSGFSELAFQAREFGRILTSGHKRKSVQLEHLTYTDFSIGNRTVTIVDPHTYPDFTDSEQNIIADRKIIHTAQLWSQLEPDTVFMSNDVMCRIRCAASGLRVQDLRQVSNVPTEFIKYFTVTDEQFSNLHNKSIIDINPDHKPENYNYVFSTDPATFNKLAYIDSGTIQIIGKATEEELRRQDISPINHEQLFLSRAIQDPTMDIIVVESLAGSGKSLVALSNAIKLVKSQTPYNSIVYIRNSVDDLGSADEAVGFLSGNDEKMAVYLHPLQDSIDAIIRSKYSNSKLKGEELEAYLTEQRNKLIAQCRLVGMIALGTRGRTFNDAIIIIDEAQNMSKATMQKLLTRIGKNCKVIVTGSLKQIDSAYLNKYSSGLSTLLDACTYTHEDINICAVPLTKVVRGKVTAFAERIFTQSKGG